jgi:hypothetical protein
MTHGWQTSNVRMRLLAAAILCLLAGCTKVDLSPHLQPLSKETLMLLGKKGMDVPSPMFIRIFKGWPFLPPQDLPDLQLFG